MPRRSDIYEAVRRIIHYPGIAREEFRIAYRHRVEGVGERIVEIQLGSVERVDKWAIHLKSGDSIPLHRVVEIRDCKGRPVWRRGLGWGVDLSKYRRTAEE
ncbi:MAG: RNA repair domain-containing protein [Aeropyrum sp.]|nr:RNA repair domain-containing protein [Aeropyrum sp.]MCE4616281.1 RNA repair domain-containing protein [Aeropyrum sp.]